MVDRRNDDNLLLLLLALVLAGDVDEPLAFELIHRLGRFGVLREQLGPDLDYVLDRALRRGPRSQRREEFREFGASLIQGLRAGLEQQTQALTDAIVAGRRSNEQPIAETAADLYDTIWLLSVGGNVSKAQMRRSLPV